MKPLRPVLDGTWGVAPTLQLQRPLGSIVPNYGNYGIGYRPSVCVFGPVAG